MTDVELTSWAHRARELAARLREHLHLLRHPQDLLACDVWQSVPGDWQSYLEKLSFAELGRLHMDRLPTRCGDPPLSLAHFLALHEHLALHRQPADDEEEDSDSALIGVVRSSSKSAKLHKKTHEVEKLSALIAAVAATSHCSRAIDIGCGKGSLSAHLSVSSGLDVVGLDAQEVLTSAAAALSSRPPSAGGGRVRIWQRTVHSDEHAPAAVDGICEEAWPAAGSSAASSGVVLCALHACGDLSPTITRCFALAPSVAALVLVPCCYNLLTVDSDPCGAEHSPMKVGKCHPCHPCGAEESDPPSTRPSASPSTRPSAPPSTKQARVPSVAKAAAATAGFPLSEVVRRTGLILSRDVRWIATQREAAALPPSWLDEASKSDGAAPPAALLAQLWRALFAALMRDHYADCVPEGTRVSTGGHARHRQQMAEAEGQGDDKVGSTAGFEFVAFAEAALARAGLPANRLDRSELARYAAARCADGVVNAARRVAAMTALQAALAPLVESLLLTDHVLFLHESGVCEDIRAVPVFRPARSPRNVAIVARKRMADGPTVQERSCSLPASPRTLSSRPAASRSRVSGWQSRDSGRVL